MPKEDIGRIVYLTATDTVVGFVSQNRDKLDMIKGRSDSKHYITALPSLSALKERTRIPMSHHNLVRRSRRTTFVLPNGRSYRVIENHAHQKLIKKLGWAYTTSANPAGANYDEDWAREMADEVIEPLKANSKRSSMIILLGKTNIKKLR